MAKNQQIIRTKTKNRRKNETEKIIMNPADRKVKIYFETATYEVRNNKRQIYFLHLIKSN